SDARLRGSGRYFLGGRHFCRSYNDSRSIGLARRPPHPASAKFASLTKPSQPSPPFRGRGLRKGCVALVRPKAELRRSWVRGCRCSLSPPVSTSCRRGRLPATHPARPVRRG